MSLSRWSTRVNKQHLHPGLLRVIERTLELLEKAGHPFKVYSGLRTFDEQDRLYAQGRTKPGHIVTKTRGGRSMHNYGLAVDMAPYNLITKDPTDLWWPSPDEKKNSPWEALANAIEVAAREVDAKDPDGLEYEWGGRWRFRDVPHCQVRTTLRELRAGLYPPCSDVEWLVEAHKTFLFGGEWMNRRVQYLLTSAGYSPGAVDGRLGSRTNIALAKFRVDHQLADDGLLTKAVVERLVRLEHSRASA